MSRNVTHWFWFEVFLKWNTHWKYYLYLIFEFMAIIYSSHYTTAIYLSTCNHMNRCRCFFITHNCRCFVLSQFIWIRSGFKTPSHPIQIIKQSIDLQTPCASTRFEYFIRVILKIKCGRTLTHMIVGAIAVCVSVTEPYQ